MRLFISAGEASGDALGAAFLDALRDRAPEVDAFGLGGPRMAASGFRALRNADEIGVVGLFEVLGHLPRLFRLLDDLATGAISEGAEAAVLIDVPDFNIRLAKRLARAGIPVAFYVGPSVWAWRAGRVRAFRRFVDKLLVLFPFEAPIWTRAGVDAVCVGHPLLDEIPEPYADAFVEPRTIALLPGSRRSEIARHLETILDAAEILRSKGLADRFVLPVAPSLDAGELRRLIARSPVQDAVELVIGERGDPVPRRRAIARASLALVASGTATLETALIGRPQIIFYRVHWLSFWVARFMARVRHLGLVNIIAGREVSPELLQGRFTKDALAQEAAKLLTDDDVRLATAEAYAEVRRRLGEGGAATRAAEAFLEMVRSSKRRSDG